MSSTRIAKYILELNDDVSAVRDNAAYALGEIGDASAVPALIEALTERGNFSGPREAERFKRNPKSCSLAPPNR